MAVVSQGRFHCIKTKHKGYKFKMDLRSLIAIAAIPMLHKISSGENQSQVEREKHAKQVRYSIESLEPFL